jgi:7-cyano-7-deazaguanine synthase
MRTAVLLSGGLDSAVLMTEEATRHDVQPLYVSVGLAWEAAEREMISRFLERTAIDGRVGHLVSLTVDMRDVYPSTHWAIQGRPPAYHTPDEDVYLPGRNIVLLAKAAMYGASADINRIVLGTLAHNPFPDATPEFRAAFSRALTLGLAHRIEIEAPYSGISKADVIRRGAAHGVPFELTMSCMNPRSIVDVATAVRHQGPRTAIELKESATKLQHCGVCSKCRERHDAFVEAGVEDPTPYADLTNVQGNEK